MQQGKKQVSFSLLPPSLLPTRLPPPPALTLAVSQRSSPWKRKQFEKVLGLFCQGEALAVTQNNQWKKGCLGNTRHSAVLFFAVLNTLTSHTLVTGRILTQRPLLARFSSTFKQSFFKEIILTMHSWSRRNSPSGAS